MVHISIQQQSADINFSDDRSFLRTNHDDFIASCIHLKCCWCIVPSSFRPEANVARTSKAWLPVAGPRGHFEEET